MSSDLSKNITVTRNGVFGTTLNHLYCQADEDGHYRIIYQEAGEIIRSKFNLKIVKSCRSWTGKRYDDAIKQLKELLPVNQANRKVNRH